MMILYTVQYNESVYVMLVGMLVYIIKNSHAKCTGHFYVCLGLHAISVV